MANVIMRATQPIEVDGTPYKPGDRIELDAAVAARLRTGDDCKVCYESEFRGVTLSASAPKKTATQKKGVNVSRVELGSGE